MKKLVLLALALSTIGTAQAQKDSTEKKRKVEITDSTMVIEVESEKQLDGASMTEMIGLMSKRVMKMQREHKETMAKIERMRKNGEISDEEAEERMEEAQERLEESMEVFEEAMENWGESFGARMEAWGEQYAAQMEQWEAEVEKAEEAGEATPPMPPVPPLPETPVTPQSPKDAQVEKEEEKIIEFRFKDDEEEEVDEHKKSVSLERTETYLDLHFGFNQNLEDQQFLIEDEPGEQDLWKSTSFQLGLGGKTRLGSPYSKSYLKWGGEFSWHNFRLTDNYFLDQDANNAFYNQADSGTTFDKSKYHIAYFNLPVMYQLDFSQMGERDESWTFGVGGYAGIRLNAKRELEYTTTNSEEIEETAEADFYTTRIRYGVMAQVGYGSFKVSASYDLNPFFRSGRGPVPGDYNMINLSVGLTL